MKSIREQVVNFFNSTRWTDSATLFLRIFAGGMLLYHGIMKIQNFDYMAGSFPTVLWMSSTVSLIVATIVEIGCALLIIAGALTRLALIPAAFTMFVATFFTHAEGGFGELSFVYMGIFIALFISGPGMYSMDRLLFLPEKKRAARRAKKSQ